MQLRATVGNLDPSLHVVDLVVAVPAYMPRGFAMLVEMFVDPSRYGADLVVFFGDADALLLLLLLLPLGSSFPLCIWRGERELGEG